MREQELSLPADAPPPAVADARRAEPPLARYYADVPNRLVALAIDAVVFTVVALLGAIVVSVVVGPAVKIDGTSVEVDEGVALVDAVVSTLLGVLYFAGTWLRFGGTPGQRLLGLRVVDAAGGRVSMRQALVRWLLLAAPLGIAALLTTGLPLSGAGDAAVDLALLGWYFVLLVTTARSSAKRGLHDRWAGTAVTKAARPVDWAEGGAARPGA